MGYTRRDIGRLALTGLPVGLPLSAHSPDVEPRSGRPDWRWEGVQVGLHVPSSLGSNQLSADEILVRCLTLGIGAIELSATVIESFLGVPLLPACLLPVPDDGLELGLHALEAEVLQDEVALARATLNDQVARWRGAVALTPLAALRRRYEDARVRIDVVEWDGLMFLSDLEVDHAFRVAKALGARALSTELRAGGPRRLGPVAGRHELRIGFRGDRATGAEGFEAAFSHGSLVGASVDVAAWMAGGHGSPLPFLEQHAGRVTQLRVTDAMGGGDHRGSPGGNPVCEVLEAMRRHQWAGQVTIELSEPAQAGSDRMKELVRAVEHCRACLRSGRSTA